MRVIYAVFCLAILIGAQSVALAGVAGKVIVTREFLDSVAEKQKNQEGAAKLYYWNEPNGISPVRPPLVDPKNDIGMVLIPKGNVNSKPEDRTTVQVRAGGMEPGVVVTRPGSSIRFKNIDSFEHELYVPNMGKFQPELQSKGADRDIEFSEEGIFEVRCKRIPHFRAYVVVVKSGIPVKLEKDGGYSAGNLEPGDYSVKVFHGGAWVHSDSLAIPEGHKKDVKVDIRLMPDKASNAEKANKDEKKEG